MTFKITFLTMLLILSINTVVAADTTIPTVTVISTINDNQVQITGNAADISNDINITSGVQRVELQIDGGSWVTASGTTSYNYTYNNLNNGYHVVGVRSIDTSNNPADIVHKTFLINSETETAIDDLSWYITISGAHFETIDDVFNVRTVTPNTDIRLMFDVNNDADTERKLRYTITRGTYESTDDIIVRSGSTVEIDEWIVASILSDGTNRFEISVDDWTTKEVVAKKDITITVSGETATIMDEDIPTWFKAVAEANNISLTSIPDSTEYNVIFERIDKQDETIKVQQREIKNLQDMVAKSSQPSISVEPAATTQPAQLIAGYYDNIWIILALVGGLYVYNKKYPGKLWGQSPGDDQSPGDSNKPLVE